MLQLTNPEKGCKNLPLTFIMVHLLHHLYGVDIPADDDDMLKKCFKQLMLLWQFFVV